MTPDWAAEIEDKYALDPVDRALLDAAVAAYQRWLELREQVEREGRVVDGRWGPKPHPLISVETQAHGALVRALKELHRRFPPDG